MTATKVLMSGAAYARSGDPERERQGDRTGAIAGAGRA